MLDRADPAHREHRQRRRHQVNRYNRLRMQRCHKTNLIIQIVVLNIAIIMTLTRAVRPAGNVQTL